MKLDEQVVSLELAKELKENGYPQEGLWWWTTGKHWTQEMDDKKSWNIKKHRYNSSAIVAPTVAELGERLPRVVSFKDKNILKRLSYLNTVRQETNSWYGCGAWGELRIWRLSTSRWVVSYLACSPNELFICDEQAKNEANSRAKMWLYLKKNNLVKEAK